MATDFGSLRGFLADKTPDEIDMIRSEASVKNARISSDSLREFINSLYRLSNIDLSFLIPILGDHVREWKSQTLPSENKDLCNYANKFGMSPEQLSEIMGKIIVAKSEKFKIVDAESKYYSNFLDWFEIKTVPDVFEKVMQAREARVKASGGNIRTSTGALSWDNVDRIKPVENRHLTDNYHRDDLWKLDDYKQPSNPEEAVQFRQNMIQRFFELHLRSCHLQLTIGDQQDLRQQIDKKGESDSPLAINEAFYKARGLDPQQIRKAIDLSHESKVMEYGFVTAAMKELSNRIKFVSNEMSKTSEISNKGIDGPKADISRGGVILGAEIRARRF